MTAKKDGKRRLVIVESPAKARTIAGYLGPDFVVESSVGHIRDLPERACTCNKYCMLCQGLYEVRLCEDGAYYCRPCREACDLQAQVGGKNSNW